MGDLKITVNQPGRERVLFVRQGRKGPQGVGVAIRQDEPGFAVPVYTDPATGQSVDGAPIALPRGAAPVSGTVEADGRLTLTLDDGQAVTTDEPIQAVAEIFEARDQAEAAVQDAQAIVSGAEAQINETRDAAKQAVQEEGQSVQQEITQRIEQDVTPAVQAAQQGAQTATTKAGEAGGSAEAAAEDATRTARERQTAQNAASDAEDYEIVDPETGDAAPSGVPGAKRSADEAKAARDEVVPLSGQFADQVSAASLALTQQEASALNEVGDAGEAQVEAVQQAGEQERTLISEAGEGIVQAVAIHDADPQAHGGRIKPHFSRAGSPVLWDSFARTATSMGTSDSGHVWEDVLITGLSNYGGPRTLRPDGGVATVDPVNATIAMCVTEDARLSANVAAGIIMEGSMLAMIAWQIVGTGFLLAYADEDNWIASVVGTTNGRGIRLIERRGGVIASLANIDLGLHTQVGMSAIVHHRATLRRQGDSLYLSAQVDARAARLAHSFTVNRAADEVFFDAIAASTRVGIVGGGFQRTRIGPIIAGVL